MCSDEDITCVGHLVIEDIIYPMKKIAKNVAGGSALYFSLGSQLAGGRTSIISKVGSNYPEAYLDLMVNIGININGIKVVSGPTIKATMNYLSVDEREYILQVTEERHKELTPKPSADLLAEIGLSKVIHIGTMSPEYQLEWVDVVHKSVSMISLDTDLFYIEGNRDKFMRLLKYVDIYFPNLLEADALIPKESASVKAKAISDLGPKIVVVKCGSSGGVIYSRVDDAYYKIPTYPTNYKDVTGAGDTFAGGFIAEYMKSKDIEKSGSIGSYVASLAIQEYGCFHMMMSMKKKIRRDDTLL